MRAAAVQLNATEDTDSQPWRGRPSRARGRRRAARELVVLPEKWTVLGTEDQLRAGAEPLKGPTLSWARRPPRELGIDLVAGSFVERRRRGEVPNTSVHVGPDGELAGRLPQAPPVRRRGRRGRATASPTSRTPGEEIVVPRTAGGAELACRSATTCASPSSTGSSRCAARGAARALRLHARHDARPLGGPAARTGDRGPGVRHRRQPDRRHGPGSASGGRSLIVDPWGVVLAQAPDSETVVAGRPRPREGRRGPRAAALARQPPARSLPLARGGPT